MSRVIENFETLAASGLRRDALQIAEAGYAALDIGVALARNIRVKGSELYTCTKTYRLPGRRVFFAGVGKGAFGAAKAVEKILGGHLSGGIALDVSACDRDGITLTETYVGTHPLPSEANMRATARLLEFLAGKSADDLVILFIAGGGSVLLCLHAAPAACLSESELFTKLTASGAAIADINTVRKHISRARGGGLARAAYPAEIAALIVSDIPGNDLALVASGPTMPDVSTVEDARAILAKYQVSLPANIELMETPKEPKYFKRVTTTLLLSNRAALDAMQAEARACGYETAIVDNQFSGEVSDLARAVAEKLHDAPAKTALLYAGESIVRLSGSAGIGGRNQEMALAALRELRDGELILPFASDGRDNTDAAGAIGDAVTRAHAEAKRLSVSEYLIGHRSYDFFQTTGDALHTGYTGTNVSDLVVALKT